MKGAKFKMHGWFIWRGQRKAEISIESRLKLLHPWL